MSGQGRFAAADSHESLDSLVEEIFSLHFHFPPLWITLVVTLHHFASSCVAVVAPRHAGDVPRIFRVAKPTRGETVIIMLLTYSHSNRRKWRKKDAKVDFPIRYEHLVLLSCWEIHSNTLLLSFRRATTTDRRCAWSWPWKENDSANPATVERALHSFKWVIALWSWRAFPITCL